METQEENVTGENKKKDSILRPRMAKWLKVDDYDAFRWVFWKKFGRHTPDEGEIAELKDQIMDADWPFIHRALSDGRGGLWFRLRCRLASREADLRQWISSRFGDNTLNGIVDVEKDRKFMRERLEVLKSRGPLLLYELEEAVRYCEALGDKDEADEYRRRLLKVKERCAKGKEA